MSKIMFQFRHKGEIPSMKQVLAMFELYEDEIDTEYGVVQTDSIEGLYLVLVDESAQVKIEKKLKDINAKTDPMVGLFSNPRIEPYSTRTSDTKNEK